VLLGVGDGHAGRPAVEDDPPGTLGELPADEPHLVRVVAACDVGVHCRGQVSDVVSVDQPDRVGRVGADHDDADRAEVLLVEQFAVLVDGTESGAVDLRRRGPRTVARLAGDEGVDVLT